MNETLEFLQTLIDRVLTLEPAKLLVVGSWALGYACRSVGTFPRSRIPQACLFFLIGSYPTVSYQHGQAVGKYVIDLTIAVILWAVSWVSYERILKPIEKKFLGTTDDPPQ